MYGNLRIRPCPTEHDYVIIYGPCFVTKKEYQVKVLKHQFYDWYHGGKLIQNAMPDLSREDREFLISGTSPEGWKQLFGDGSE